MKVALALIAISLHWSHASGLAIDQREISSQSLVKNELANRVDASAATGKAEAAAAGTTAAAAATTTTMTTTTVTADNMHARNDAARQHDHRRPIWALAHMVNSIKELDYRLASGANAIEVDVTFGPAGDPLWTYHGPPCDCWRHCYQREDFHDYLNHVRQIAIEQPNERGQNLSLLFLDLKLDPLGQAGKVRAGQELAKAVMGDLFRHKASDGNRGREGHPSKFHLILSVNHVNDIDLVHNFIHTLELNNASHLMPLIGFDVGMNDDLQLIESMWRKFNGQLNLWQGDGFTNCFSPFYNLQRLSRAIAKRDQAAGYPAKVYHWTIDLHDRMRESILLGADAIMSNHPERLLTVLKEPELAHDFRLATRHDNPFKKLTRRAVSRSGETARYQRSANSNSGGLLGNLMDILTSWYSYIREIPFFSLPATLLSKSSGASKRNSSAASGGHVQLGAIMPVKLTSVPEYKVENVTAGPNSNVTLETAANTSAADDSRSSAGSGDQSEQQKQELEYQPTWYVSLVSNLLVSALRSFLPT